MKIFKSNEGPASTFIFPLQADRCFPFSTIFNSIFKHISPLFTRPPYTPVYVHWGGMEKELAVRTRFMAVLVTVITWKEAEQRQWHSSGGLHARTKSRWEMSRS